MGTEAHSRRSRVATTADVGGTLPSEEELHRLVAENVADVVWVLDLELRYIYVSPSVQHQRGYSPAELLGRSPRDLVASAVREELQQQYRRRLAEAEAGDPAAWEAWTWDAQVPRKDGSLMWASIHVRFLPGADGRPCWILGATRDITERKQAELAARRFKLAADSSSELLAGLDQQLRYLFANAAYLAKHGLRENEVLGRHFSEIVGVEAFARLEPHLKRCLAGESVRFETSLEYPGEGTRFLEAEYFPLQEGSDCIGVVGVARDITERKRSEQALLLEARYRQLIADTANQFVDLAPDALTAGLDAALERLGRFVDADEAYVALFDKVDGPWVVANVWRRRDPPPPTSSPATVLAAASTWVREQLPARRPIAISEVGEFPDVFRERCDAQGVRSLVWLPLVSDGVELGVLGFHWSVPRHWFEKELELLHLVSATISSVVGRERAEERRKNLESQLHQSQKLESIGRLAGGIAHDFNNILSTILGVTELLLDDIPSDAPMRCDVEEIVGAATRASELTQQLLAFSRRQVIEPQVVELGRVVRKLEPMLARLLGEDVHLVTSVSAPRTTVRVDVTQMEQVVINLAVNARDAMPRGGELRIEVAGPADDDGTRTEGTVELLVKDQGAGMDAELLERIFEPFFTTKEVGRGSGLGLSMVLGIVEQSGGSISVESTPGQGSCFRVALPAVFEPATHRQSQRPPPRVGGGETVLVVEDDPSVRGLAVRQLNRLGFRVLAASRGDEAIRLAEQHSGVISLLLTDVVLPAMSGHELARRLLNRSPNMKVIYTSGYTRDVVADHGVPSDGLHFIAKPYTLQELAEAVVTTLATK